MKDVSFVIVGWNVRDLLRDCLNSIYKETKGIDFEIIYVDNASKDGTIQMVKESFPDVIIVQNTHNEGFAAANNRGFEIAKGQYILLLNSDTVILNNAIAKTVEFANNHPKAAVVGCKVLNPDKTLQPTMCFMFPSILNLILSSTYLYKIFPRSKFFGRELMTWWDKSDVRDVEVITGCYMLVRRKAVDQVGVMDERYFIYSEETDWCYRFKKKGWRILFTPDPEIIHYGGQTTKQIRATFRLQLSGSRLIFLKLHRNWFTFLFARLLISLFLFVRIPYWLAIAVFNRNKRKMSMNTAMTYLKGGFYSLVDWKSLLINKDKLKGNI